MEENIFKKSKKTKKSPYGPSRPYGPVILWKKKLKVGNYKIHKKEFQKRHKQRYRTYTSNYQYIRAL
jgi:hypothetical protein